MSSKIKRPGKCYKCGWEFPATYRASTCKFCGGPVYRNVGPEPGNCKECGAYCENIHAYNDHRCRECHNKSVREAYHKKGQSQATKEAAMQRSKRKKEKEIRIAEESYANWKAQLNSITTHSLTEDEWLQACAHFNGCAMCGADSIDARMYFIKYQEGGKYNACNIIPACEKCATDRKVNPNPFRTMNRYINSSAGLYRGQSKERLKKIVDYLQSKIEEAKNELPEET